MFVMTHPTYLREKARSMRIERQLTIDELAERLALSRSTIYYWVRDLPIPGSGSGGVWPEASRRKGNLAMQRKYRLLREAAYREGLREYDGLVAAPTFRDFVCLYIAEGYKRNRNSVSIGNSDPAVIRSRLGGSAVCREKRRRLLDPVPRRPEPEGAARFLGAGSGSSRVDQAAAQVEQQSARRSCLAFPPWCPQVACMTRCSRALQAWIDRLRSEWQ